MGSLDAVSSLHLPKEAIKVKLLFVLLLVPKVSEFIQEALLALLSQRTRGVHSIILIDARAVVFGVAGWCWQCGRIVRVGGDIEEVKNLIRLHGLETGVLLVHDSRSDVDLEALETRKIR